MEELIHSVICSYPNVARKRGSLTENTHWGDTCLLSSCQFFELPMRFYGEPANN